jgi:hypothetical protein
MKLRAMKTMKYVEFRLEVDRMTIDTGLLNDDERDAIVESFLAAMWDAGHSDSDKCAEWFQQRLKKCGIPVTTKEET